MCYFDISQYAFIRFWVLFASNTISFSDYIDDPWKSLKLLSVTKWINDRFLKSKYNEMQIYALCLLKNSFATTLFIFFISVKLSKEPVQEVVSR